MSTQEEKKGNLQSDAESLRANRPSPDRILKKIVPLVQKHMGDAAELLLSGSANRGTATVTSDNDYLIKTDHDVTKSEVANLHTDLQQHLGSYYDSIRTKTNAISLSKPLQGDIEIDLIPKDTAYTKRRSDYESHKKYYEWKVFQGEGNQALRNAATKLKKDLKDAGATQLAGSEIDGIAATVRGTLSDDATDVVIYNAVLDDIVSKTPEEIASRFRKTADKKSPEKRAKALQNAAYTLKKQNPY